MKGRITKYIDDRGFGFIKGSDEIDRFFHIKDVKSELKPEVGNSVEFTPSKNDKGEAARDVFIQPKVTESCGLCGSLMVERKGPHSYFLGCSSYPKCKGTKPLTNIEKPPKLKTVVLISCTGEQRPGRWKATELYESNSFNENLACAKILSDEVYILSSAKGLIELDTEVENYNVDQSAKTDKELDVWGAMVAEQMKEQGIDVDNSDFIILAWRHFYKPLLKYIKFYELPFYKVSPQDKSSKLKELLKERGV